MTTGLEHPDTGHDPEEPEEVLADTDPEAPTPHDAVDLPLEADPADVIEQRRVVPTDDEEDRDR